MMEKKGKEEEEEEKENRNCEREKDLEALEETSRVPDFFNLSEIQSCAAANLAT